MTFGGTFKWVLIIVVIILAVLVIIPFVLRLAGVDFSFFKSRGGASFSSETLLRSQDSGQTWQAIKITVPRRTPAPGQILSLAFHPQDPETIFVGTRSSSFWQSNDRGNNFSQVADVSRILDPEADVYKVKISASDPRVMYLSVFEKNRGRLLKSEDSGKNFREVYFTGAEKRLVSDIFLDPADNNHLVISTTEGGVWESFNGGKTWRLDETFTEAIASLAVNPSLTNEMYVITESGNIFKTFDSGENWADLTDAVREAEEKQNVEGIVTDFGAGNPFSFRARATPVLSLNPQNPALLYLGSGQGLLVSPNGGFTWEKADILIPKEILPVSAITIHPRNPQIILAAGSNQIYQTDNGGRDWTISVLPTKLRISGIFINPVRPEIMYVIGK